MLMLSKIVHRPSYRPRLNSRKEKFFFSLQGPCLRSIHKYWLDGDAVDLDL